MATARDEFLRMGVAMSETFKVDPNELRVFSGALDGLSRENYRAVNYVKEWVSPSGNAGGTFMTALTAALEKIETELDRNYARLTPLAANAATQISSAADMYQTTDYDTAAALDRTYPGVADE